MSEPIEESYILCLSTFPNYQPLKIIDAIDSNFYGLRQKRIKTFGLSEEEYPHYQTIHFQLWGSWDLLTIVKADASQQIVKIIQPELNSNSSFREIKTKIISGISFANQRDKSLQRIGEGKYISYTSLKISNKWLIGNGRNILDCVFKYLDHVLGLNYSEGEERPDHLYFLSYSAYEISLAIFSDSLNDLIQIVNEIREVTIHQLQDYGSNELMALYGDTTQNSNLFSDSNTIFGFNIALDRSWLSLKNEYSCSHKIEVRPSHLFRVQKYLKQEEHVTSIIAGKSDISSTQTGLKVHDCLSYKIFLLDFLKSNELPHDDLQNFSDFLNRIRKIKTLPELGNVGLQSKNPDIAIPEGIFDLNFPKINDDLRKLKISKTVRNQLIKLFSNFRNNIHDSINLNQFLDLLPFVESIKSLVDNELFKRQKYWQGEENDIRSILELEDFFKSYLKVFTSCYLLRSVNEHDFDELPDFMVTNTQFQTLATLYDNLVKMLAAPILGKNEADCIVTSFDDSNTTITKFNLRLSAFNIFEPAMVFNILSKEIITLFIKSHKKREFDSINYAQQDFKNYVRRWFDEHSYHKLSTNSSLIENFNIEYLLVDFLRLKYFFNNDFRLFHYWNIAYLIQQPSSYLGNGKIDSRILRSFCFRLLFLGYYVDRDFNGPFSIVSDISPNIDCKGDWEDFAEQCRYFFETIELKEQLELNRLLKQIPGEVENIIKQSDEFRKVWSVCLEFIKFIKAADGDRPAFLARNWVSGEYNLPFSLQKDEKQEPYFLFDPQGGVFFHNYKRMNKYVKERNKIFFELYVLACDYKKTIFKSFRSDEKK